MIRRALVTLFLTAWASCAQAAITFNWANGNDNSTTIAATTLNIGATAPAGANGTFTSGDLLIATVTVQVTSGDPGVISTPTGWTQIDQIYNTGGTARMATFYKIAGGSETGSYAVSWTNASRTAGWAIIDYGGVNTSTPIDAHSISNTYGTTVMTATSVSPTGAADVLVAVFCAVNAGSYPLTAAPPSGMTQRLNAGAGSSSISPTYVADQQLSASGATGTRSVTMSGGNDQNSALIALLPASGGGSTVRSLGLMGVGQ